jgi:hypothetical protein
MKIKPIIIYSLVLLLSCSSSIFKGPYVDPVLEYAYDDWKTECKSRKIKLRHNTCDLDSILYDVLDEGIWGRCFGNKIVINRLAVAPTDTFLIKLIMYHELGHCAFDYGHIDYGVDIMNSVLPVNKIIAYKWFWDLLKEDYFMRYQSPKTRQRLRQGNSYGEVCIQSET